jgi:hypothetical protein
VSFLVVILSRYLSLELAGIDRAVFI